LGPTFELFNNIHAGGKDKFFCREPSTGWPGANPTITCTKITTPRVTYIVRSEDNFLFHFGKRSRLLLCSYGFRSRMIGSRCFM
jgi:hypothetical protein